MKKYLLLFIPVLMALGFAAQAVPAFAQTAASPATLSPQEAASIKQTLDALQVTLNQISSRIQSGAMTPSEKVVWASTLTVIRTGLAQINTSLDSRRMAIAPAPAPVPRPVSPPIVSRPPSVVLPPSSQPTPGGQLVPPGNTANPVTPTPPAFNPPVSPVGPQTASTEAQFDPRNLLWLALLLLIGLGAIFYFRQDSTEKVVVAPAPKQAELLESPKENPVI